MKSNTEQNVDKQGWKKIASVWREGKFFYRKENVTVCQSILTDLWIVEKVEIDSPRRYAQFTTAKAACRWADKNIFSKP